MVGRFVQQQQVGLLPHQQRQRQTCLFAAGHRPDHAVDGVAAEVEAAKEAAQLQFARLRRQLLHMPQRRFVVAQGVELVLGEVADAQHLGADHLAGQRLQLTGQQLHQR
ncbi:hypothetical protein D3C85_1381130 [compost metagenome]